MKLDARPLARQKSAKDDPVLELDRREDRDDKV
jgi:hypothetical protein